MQFYSIANLRYWLAFTIFTIATFSLGQPRLLAQTPPNGLGDIPAPTGLQLTIHSDENQFSDVAAWNSFDAGSMGIGVDLDGYYANVFDGRYIYFAPYYNDSYHGEVLRYDTTQAIDEAAAWSAYDPGANGVGNDPDGFTDVVFDGRYLYFVPLYDGTNYFGEVLRFDTEAEFSEVTSWTTFDPGASGVGADADGYMGGVFDGRYLYLVPYHNGTAFHGEVLRFDTTATFAASSSWSAFDPDAAGLGVEPAGFHGAAFDGRYIYFTPYENNNGRHGELLRLDTTIAFDDIAAWTTFDPGSNGVGSDTDGYSGQVIAGNYLYLSPSHNGTNFHGEVLRYDLRVDFADSTAWSAFDPGSNGVGTDADGYYDAIFDGQFIYFTPFYNGSSYHGEFMRYDTLSPFGDSAAWSTFTPANNSIGTQAVGYLGAVQAGENIYFTPFYDGTNYHGEVLSLQVDRIVSLSWESAPEAILSYRIFKNGNLSAEVTTTEWIDAAPAQGDIYSVQALTDDGTLSTHSQISSPIAGISTQASDSTPPELRLLTSEEILNGLVTLAFAATDGLDPAETLQVEIQIGTADWQSASWDETVAQHTFHWDTTLEAEGPLPVNFRVSDRSGNQSNGSTEFFIVSLTPTAISLNAVGQVTAPTGPALAIFGLIAIFTIISIGFMRRH